MLILVVAGLVVVMGGAILLANRPQATVPIRVRVRPRHRR
jgi:hypothetical protein